MQTHTNTSNHWTDLRVILIPSQQETLMCLCLSVHESRRVMQISLCAHMDDPVCVLSTSLFFERVSPSHLSLLERAQHVPPHTCRMPSRSIAPSPSPPPAPAAAAAPQRQRKEQESLEMNGQPSASWQGLNGNVKLATDPFVCLLKAPSHWGAQTQ